jgi:hypothetical protein
MGVGLDTGCEEVNRGERSTWAAGADFISAAARKTV